jgi:spore coat polysaccharide biosynthesis protein SpsF
MRGDALGPAFVRARGFTVHESREAGTGWRYADWLGDLAARVSAQVLFVDVRDELSAQDLAVVRAQGVRIAVLDDGADRRLAADWAFYPPVPSARGLDWTGFSGRVCLGWEWIPLRREFAQRPDASAPASGPRVLVCGGGSDPAGGDSIDCSQERHR